MACFSMINEMESITDKQSEIRCGLDSLPLGPEVHEVPENEHSSIAGCLFLLLCKIVLQWQLNTLAKSAQNKQDRLLNTLPCKENAAALIWPISLSPPPPPCCCSSLHGRALWSEGSPNFLELLSGKQQQQQEKGGKTTLSTVRTTSSQLQSGSLHHLANGFPPTLKVYGQIWRMMLTTSPIQMFIRNTRGKPKHGSKPHYILVTLKLEPTHIPTGLVSGINL